ncbi:MAG: DUF1684 domain-containing protein [Cyclobacteriaceae bacterium]
MKKLLFILIPIGIILLFLFQSHDSDEYINSLEKYREEKHNFFKNSEGSPFVQKKIDYQPVTFFPPDPDFKVNARLEKLSTRETLKISNTDGSAINYLKFANAKFKLKGNEYSLLILKALGFGNQYLTAFIDKTSGISTYGGGRYLDLVIGKSDRIEIDFNKAYNPYCAYSEDYLCPLPPRENFLEVAIEAGEKDYKTE